MLSFKPCVTSRALPPLSKVWPLVEGLSLGLEGPQTRTYLHDGLELTGPSAPGGHQ